MYIEWVAELFSGKVFVLYVKFLDLSFIIIYIYILKRESMYIYIR